MLTIKVRQNGSLLVEGEDVKLVDWNGQEYILQQAAVRAVPLRPVEEEAVLLQLAKLCDFKADEAAPGPNVAPPAER